MRSEFPMVLQAENLWVEFATVKGAVQAVKGVSLQVERGKITALIGESGSGKSAAAMAIAGILDHNGALTKGRVTLQGRDLFSLRGKKFRDYRGKQIGVIFQEPMESLNPLLRVGDQLCETLRVCRKLDKRQAKQEAIRLFERVGLPEPERLLRKYPFQLSGGMCQRVMIAIALGSQPSLLIADEPTTALDVTVQSQILRQIQEMCCQFDMGVLFITHDLGIVAEIADEVYVMKQGEIVEHADVFTLFASPKHAYTKKLLESIL